jgi:hypothetical protein
LYKEPDTFGWCLLFGLIRFSAMIRILSIEDAHRLKPTEKAILTLFMQDHNLKEIAENYP